jgi:hypothetical protein
MKLLEARSKQNGFPPVYTFNTFFYTKLTDEGYSRVKRWTKKVSCRFLLSIFRLASSNITSILSLGKPGGHLFVRDFASARSLGCALVHGSH